VGFSTVGGFFDEPRFGLWVIFSSLASSLWVSSLDSSLSDSESFLLAGLCFGFDFASGFFFVCVRWCAKLAFFVGCVMLQPRCEHAKT
jgi:hypothetical protein